MHLLAVCPRQGQSTFYPERCSLVGQDQDQTIYRPYGMDARLGHSILKCRPQRSRSDRPTQRFPFPSFFKERASARGRRRPAPSCPDGTMARPCRICERAARRAEAACASAKRIARTRSLPGLPLIGRARVLARHERTRRSVSIPKNVHCTPQKKTRPARPDGFS